MNEGRQLEALTRDECIRLLEKHAGGVGRVAIAGPRPVILPVNYAVDNHEVIFRTAAGTKLDAAVANTFVAFEVDDVLPEWRGGWSVLVRGQSHEVKDPDEIERLSKLPLHPWAAGDRDHFVRISRAIFTGRRFL
jgi:uncharacterized protein